MCSSDLDAIVLSVDSPALPAFRQTIVDTLGNLGFPEKANHGFTPHITVKYIADDAEMPIVRLPEGPVIFDKLYLWCGEDQTGFELTGNNTESESVSMPPGTEETVKSDKSHLDTVADNLAKVSRGATAEDIKAKILAPWLTTTIASPGSLSLQATACRTFGHQPPGFMAEEFEAATIHWDLLYAIGEMYNLTQDELTKSGDFSENDTIPIYHPYVPQESTPKGWQKGDEVRIRVNPLTSWTRDIQEAATFAEFLASPGSPGFVLKTFIPIKSIISIPETGFGMPGTKEVIPAGGEYEAIVEMRFA